MEYYSAIKRGAFESVLIRWMNLEPIIQSEVSQKEKDKYCILMNIWNLQRWHQRSHVSSVQFSSSVMSNSLQPQGLHHTRLPSPSPTPRAYSNSCPSSRWCHPSVSSSVIPFSSRFQSFPASGSFQMSQFFTSGGQSRCKAAKEKQM